LVYKKNFALAIKAHGKILRESGEQVFLPYGCEYSIVLKNLHSKKASVKVWIDGQLVTEGCSLIIKPNESIDLERFIRNGNLTSVGNRFKFIERTESIENHRGIKIDDGLVRIEYQFERQVQPIPTPMMQPTYRHYPPVWTSTVRGMVPGQSIGDEGFFGGQVSEILACNAHSSVASVSNVGITVEGSISDQAFETCLPLWLEDEVHAMTLQLVGEVAQSGVRVEKPITVKAKPTCKTCGKLNKATSKFCSNCGTSLQIV
jgi:hypothetical protein